MTTHPVRSVSLTEYRRNPVRCLGAAVDGEAIYLGYDPGPPESPLGVLLSWAAWCDLIGEAEAKASLEPAGDDEGATVDDEPESIAEAAQQEAEPTPTPATPPTRKPVPITGAAGLWCCYEPGCSGVSDTEGGYCWDHKRDTVAEQEGEGGIYLEG